MKAAFWLTRKELSGRRISFLIGLAMCGLIVSMFIFVEMSLISRESSVRRDIDMMGPPIIVIPPGKSMADLRRFDLGPVYFGEHSFVSPLVDDLSPHIRAVDSRLSIRMPVSGRDRPVIGIDPTRVVTPHDQLQYLLKNQVAIGNLLADRLGLRTGDPVRIAGSTLFVNAVLSSAGDATDMAVFMNISVLRRLSGLKDAVNEIRIFPKNDTDMDPIRKKLAARGDSLRSISIDRGDIAENRITQTLSLHRYAIYLALGAILSLTMMIWTFLDARERGIELATVAALGGSSATIIALLMGRSSIVGAAGALIGAGFSLGVKWVAGGAFPADILALSGILGVSLCGTVFFSMAGAMPVALTLSGRDHVALLQN